MRLARGEHGESKEEKGFAEDGEGHVDAAGPLRRRRRIEREHAVGRYADERVDKIEREKVVGDEHAEAADHGEEPGDGGLRFGPLGLV